MVSQNPTVILQNSHNVQKELDGGKEQKEVLPFSFLFLLFKTQAFQRLLICAFLCSPAPSAACLSTSCSCWLGQELKCDCLSLGHPEWFHIKSYVLFSPNAIFAAGEHLKKGNRILRNKNYPDTYTHSLGANLPSVYLNKVNVHFHMGARTIFMYAGLGAVFCSVCLGLLSFLGVVLSLAGTRTREPEGDMLGRAAAHPCHTSRLNKPSFLLVHDSLQ